MWTLEDAVNNSTNKVIVPRDGVIAISKPDTVRVSTYVNDVLLPTEQVPVKTGDTVYFKLTNYKKGETPIGIAYEDVNDVIMLPGKVSNALTGKSRSSSETTTEEDNMTPQDTINLFSNPMGGAMGGAGAGLGAGLVGGLLGTALFGRNGLNGGLGVDGAGAGALAATLRNPPEQDMANMSLMAAIGAVDKSVAVSTATMEASQATQTLGITSQLNSVTSSIAGRIDNLKDVVNSNSVALMQGQNALTQTVMAGNSLINQNVMENRYQLSRDISNDGEKTRALITQQYEINLQRQLADANAAIIELRGNNGLQSAAAGITLTNTNNINQMQQQSQQQQQYNQLANMIWGLGQNITNGAINVGSGTQTANPTNTNTSIR
jgi:hypothetical protein